MLTIDITRIILGINESEKLLRLRTAAKIKKDKKVNM
jgi:hypothetical protein